MKLLTFAQLKATRGHPFSRRHTERLILEGKFPAPIKAGEHRVAWIEAEVDDHYERLAAQRAPVVV
jgi:predicted DNA-binding transcriptional regulator AlpA